MADARSSYETDYTKSTIPVIKVNGERVEGDEVTEGYVPFKHSITERPRGNAVLTRAILSLRNKYSALCDQVVTACDSGRTLEEGHQAYREHQQAKIHELQVS
jgi:hypothetical protein